MQEPLQETDTKKKSNAYLDEKPTKNKTHLHFPIASLVCSFLFILVLVSDAISFNIPNKTIQDLALIANIKNQPYLLTLSLISIYIIDYLLYHRSRKKLISLLIENHEKLIHLWESKQSQQHKAINYLAQADKLKNFISEKLLDFLEYDEKFIHFKGIAAEVRHNGVISYDKIITALEKAMEQQQFLSIYEKNDDLQSENNISPHTLNAMTTYQNAIDALRYLWDLLDLSTAESISLHIGKRLIEWEEHYFQLNLDTEKLLDSTQSIPVSPTFSPLLAALKTLQLVSDEEEIANIITLSKINHSVLDEEFIFQNNNYTVHLFPCDALLGNINHIVLLFENLIKNALFFTQKIKQKNLTDRINIRLQQESNQVKFQIYNRGPQIEEDSMEAIFKLGYSTRRAHQHHGKGLGLFFVNEIIKGYQGTIEVKNISTPAMHFKLIVKLASDEYKTLNIETKIDNNQLYCQLENNETWEEEIIFLSDIPISEVCISCKHIDNNKNICEDVLESTDKLFIDAYSAIEWFQPEGSPKALWHVTLNIFKKQHKLIFKPLNIEGVLFEVKLPTAESMINEPQMINL